MSFNANNGFNETSNVENLGQIVFNECHHYFTRFQFIRLDVGSSIYSNRSTVY